MNGLIWRACAIGMAGALAASAMAASKAAVGAHPLTAQEQQDVASLMRCEVPDNAWQGPRGERLVALYAKLFEVGLSEDQVNGAQSTHSIAVWGGMPGTLFMVPGLAYAVPIVWMRDVTLDQARAMLAARGVALTFDREQSANQPYRVYSSRVTGVGGPIYYMLADMRMVPNTQAIGPGVTVSCTRVQLYGSD